MAIGDPLLEGKSASGAALTDVSIYYNADDYGTHGTQAAVTAAITAAAGGGVVYLSSGTWTISSTIYITNVNIHIRGSGIGSTVVNGTSGNPILHFTTGAWYGNGVQDIWFTASSGATAIYLADGNYSGTNGGGSYGNFTGLHFGANITTGIRVGIYSGWMYINNLNSTNSSSLSSLVHIDTSVASEANDNPTGIIISGLRGWVTIAGVYCTGDAFGDLVVSDLNIVGVGGTACAVSLVGGAYYSTNMNFSNIHMDGLGAATFKASNCSSFTVVGITKGGLITNYVSLAGCTTYYYLTAGGVGSG